jgi:hypothetical protein
MSRINRRIAAAAIGTLIASPALALFTASAAGADSGDLASIGPIAIDGYTETFSYDTGTGAFDNFLSGSSNLVPFDLDAFYGTPGSGDAGLLFTIPLLFQGGFEDIDGTVTPIFTFDSADFLNADAGLVDLGGIPPASQDVVSIGPFDLGGYNDTFSINTDTYAIDNLLAGSSSGLPFDVDFFTGAPGSDTSEFLLTVPSLFQVGLDDAAGVITPIFSIDPSDFVNVDVGLSAIGGV